MPAREHDMRNKKYFSIKDQRGVSLFEALIAVLILAFGILGMLGMQLGILAETRNSTQRSQAIKIIGDLSERIKSNPDRFRVISNYALNNWAVPGVITAFDCDAASCTSEQQAQWDLNAWRRSVNSYVNGFQANTFFSFNETDDGNRRQIGVMIAWRLNSRSNNASDNNFSSPFSISLGSGSNAIDCPENMICHLAYIQP
ncbi:type IV pilus modification protein PilV [Lampropedia puyangensis]|uniref:Type IV pilus modification protein PilV n=1 Tax=Lampropedia puyangensis TaxID=1330072 RepID=A0A4S8F017_9BURK|nr:type IV pilus modification protein PilV [Lampropedia puyangensis]THT99323.1 type IV pilus modification protein PilV [Lampropedia puyangensis]